MASRLSFLLTAFLRATTIRSLSSTATVRALGPRHAEQYHVASDRIGMWGFSAGGHLVGMVGTHFDDGNPQAADPIDRVSDRPDFVISSYGGLSLQPGIAKPGAMSQSLRRTLPRPSCSTISRPTCTSPRARRRSFFMPPRPTNPFPCLSTGPSTPRWSKPVFPRRCTSFKLARTARRLVNRTPNSPSGRVCSKTGCASTAGSHLPPRRPLHLTGPRSSLHSHAYPRLTWVRGSAVKDLFSAPRSI